MTLLRYTGGAGEVRPQGHTQKKTTLKHGGYTGGGVGAYTFHVLTNFIMLNV